MSDPDVSDAGVDAGVFATALAAVAAARAALAGVTVTGWGRVSGPGLLTAARQVEQLSRQVGAVQIQLAGQLQTRGVAAAHGCASTAALLGRVRSSV